MKKVLIAVLALAACSKQTEPVAGPRTAELDPMPMGSNHPEIKPLADPDLNGGHIGRAPRRITVGQLKASILTTTGRQWTQIDQLSASLGKADFALVNSESTETNLVFAKFLEDGAREVCMNASNADNAQADVTKRVLSPNIPTDLAKVDRESAKKNLVYLSTRFWGQPLSGPELDTWADTFQGVATRAIAANRRTQAWGAICVALMTDPRFITY